MRPIKEWFVGGLALLGLGCANPQSKPRTEFTPELHKEMTKSELGNLQFYLSSEIKLEREMSSEDRGVSETHTYKIARGRRVETVMIDPQTPGIVADTQLQALYVSFEEPVDGKELTFGFAVDPERGDRRYYLVAQAWTPTGGTVKYGDREFRATPQSREAYLMIDFERTDVQLTDRRRLPGRRHGQ